MSYHSAILPTAFPIAILRIHFHSDTLRTLSHRAQCPKVRRLPATLVTCFGASVGSEPVANSECHAIA
jgi:hypothetical protein